MEKKLKLAAFAVATVVLFIAVIKYPEAAVVAVTGAFALITHVLGGF